MKIRTFISVFFIMAMLIITGSCATMKKAISEEDFKEAFSGTWVNTEYSGVFPHGIQKRINYPDGVWEFYRMISDITLWAKGKSTIIDKWIDSRGNILYKSHWESYTHPEEGYEMGKISKSGNTLELLFSFGDYPIEEWEPDNIRYTYWIYYRQ